MKVCSACERELSRECFSKKQWQMKRFRRCKECIDGHREIQRPDEERDERPVFTLVDEEQRESKRSEHPTENEGASCWICLEEGPNEFGGRLRRDCSCRGGSGYAHLSCLVDYAKEKYRGTKFIVEANRPWEECPNCKQCYLGDLGAELAAEYLSFVETTYPRSQSKIMEAMNSKLDALKRRLEKDDLAFPTKKRIEVEQLARRILSVVRLENSMYAVLPVPTPRSFLIEGEATFILGLLHLEDGKRDSARAAKASECFKKCIEIGKAIGYTQGVDEAEEALALATSLCDGYSDNDIRKLQRIYREHVNKYGPDHDDTLATGNTLAGALKSTAHTVEAERLLMNLAAVSKRLHGPDHPMTRGFRSILHDCKKRHVSMTDECGELQLFQAMGYTDDGSKCVARGPMPRKSSKCEVQSVGKSTLPVDDILPMHGTPVMCKGLTRSIHLNGKIGDVRGWDEESDALEVHFEDNSLVPRLVMLENLSILFELPPSPDVSTSAERAQQRLNEDWRNANLSWDYFGVPDLAE